MDIAGLDEHHLQGRHLRLRRAPSVGAVLGDPARLRTSAASAPGLVRMVRPWNEWLIVWGYDISQPPPVVDDARPPSQIVQEPARPARPRQSRSPAPGCGATTRCTRPTCRSGGCSAAGDAVHRHPPSQRPRLQHLDPGLLQPRLEAGGGAAGPGRAGLLETYSAERAPVARQIVQRANKSSREFVQFFEVLGLMEAETEEEMRQQIEERKANTPRGRGQARGPGRRRWSSRTTSSTPTASSWGSSTSQPRSFRMDLQGPSPTRDPELYYEPSTVPGSHLPHVWVGRQPRARSPPSTSPRMTRFTLLTGIAGEPWAAAAEKVGEELGVPLETVIIGPGREVTDLYYDWARIREVDGGRRTPGPPRQAHRLALDAAARGP